VMNRGHSGMVRGSVLGSIITKADTCYPKITGRTVRGTVLGSISTKMDSYGPKESTRAISRTVLGPITGKMAVEVKVITACILRISHRVLPSPSGSLRAIGPSGK
jgi:hypothetical protein